MIYDNGLGDKWIKVVCTPMTSNKVPVTVIVTKYTLNSKLNIWQSKKVWCGAIRNDTQCFIHFHTLQTILKIASWTIKIEQKNAK